MFTLISVVWNSFKMALEELKNNKLRTFLSLFGITIGIFCIIGVLATIGSLENKVQGDLKGLGTNTVYIDKWDYNGGPDYPWWKFIKRPMPKYDEMKAIKVRSSLASAVAFNTAVNENMESESYELSNVNGYGVTEDFNKILTVNVGYGRYITEAEFNQGAAVGVLGYTNAEKLFGEAERGVGKMVKYNGKAFKIVGVTKKEGKSFVGGWEFDESFVMPYRMFLTMYNSEAGDPKIIVMGKEGLPSSALLDELRGIMRSLHRLKPKEADDFALNDVNMFSEQTSSIFGSISLGGGVIALLSLIVGGFGVANIMFVTVRERTSQIGLKKAIGAKRSTILTEFLLESAFLCLLGGFIGILLVFILTQVLSPLLGFPIAISMGTMMLAITICLVVGVLAGIIPAFIAAKMNPVVAIRMK